MRRRQPEFDEKATYDVVIDFGHRKESVRMTDMDRERLLEEWAAAEDRVVVLDIDATRTEEALVHRAITGLASAKTITVARGDDL